MRVLLIEDDSATAQSIELMLKAEGFNIYATDLGEEGVDLGKIYDYDLILLDLNLPDMSGMDVLRTLRVAKINTPIMILSGTSEIETKVRTFSGGADDYMTKPFSFSELLLRIRALNRRAVAPARAELQVGDLLLNLSTREVYRDRARVSLTRSEYSLLERLMRDAGQVVPREILIASLGREIGSNTLDAFVRLLRNKIDGDDAQKLIHTVRGIGYVISSGWES